MVTKAGALLGLSTLGREGELVNQPGPPIHKHARLRALARFGPIVTLVVVLTGLLLPVPAVAAPTEQPPPADKVLLFSLPRVTWADFAAVELPHLTELLSRSMVAQLSVRTAGSRTMSSDGYATIGAGNRADGAEKGDVGRKAYDRDEPVDGRPAYRAYEVRVGREPTGEVVHVGLARVQEINKGTRYAAVPGTLGSALDAADRSTAVIANADIPELEIIDRAAALAVMNRNGEVDGGTVGPQLMRPDPTAPYGVSMDPEAVVAAFDEAWQRHDVTLVEPGDLERVDTFYAQATPQQWQALRRKALREADALLGELLERVDLSRDLVIVLTPAAPRKGEELGVFSMAGPGIEPGLAVSGTTRRNGYLTLPDIAPTILERLGVEIPSEVTGTPIKLGQARPVDDAMIATYVRANEIAVFRDSVTSAVTVVFIVLQVLAYLFASLILILRNKRWFRPRWRPVTRFLLLTVLAIPTTTFLSGLFPYDRLGPAGYVLALIGGAAALAAGGVAIGWLFRNRMPTASRMLPPLALVALTWTTMIVDVLFYDGRLQLDTAFGYSPIVAGRFSGYGNFAFSLVAICAVIMVTGVWAIAVLSRRSARFATSPNGPAPMAVATESTAPAMTGDGSAVSRGGDSLPDNGATPHGADHKPTPSRPWRAVALLMVAAVLAFTVVVDGYPAYGSDVGGVLAAVPSFALVILLLAGIRVTWRRLVAVGLLTIATITVFAVVDLSRPAEQRTHLGRLFERISDTGGVLTIIERKLLANLSILTSSIWTWVVPIAAAFLIVLSWRRFNALRTLWREIPGMPACLWGSAVVAFLGFALNDSGIAVPAMMSTILLPYLGYLTLRREPEPQQTDPKPRDEVADGGAADRVSEPETAPATTPGS